MTVFSSITDTTRTEVRVWRCTGCGKWSHAKRKPSRHSRWVTPGDPAYDESRNEARGDDGWVDHGVPWGHTIKCGPFEPWVARPIREIQ